LQEGYCDTFAELLETTAWDEYGCSSGNPKCTDCMVHSGYEATAVDETFSSLRGLLATARLTLFGPKSKPGALDLRPLSTEPAELIPLDVPSGTTEQTDTATDGSPAKPKSRELPILTH